VATREIAVISQTDALPAADLARAVAAIQKQVLLDFSPVWRVTATVALFPTLASKPGGYWPVVIRDDIGVRSLGVHLTEDGDSAFALVTYRPEDWTLTLSHEVLEMLADPFGTSFLSGPDPDDPARTVEYLPEVCDPCQGAVPDFAFDYKIDGVPVSDFVFPAYYEGFGGPPYSHARHVTAPLELLPWGYLVYRTSGPREWWYRSFDGTRTETRSLGANLSRPDVHLRGLVDRTMRERLDPRKARRKARRGRAAAYPAARSAVDAPAADDWWQRQIDRVLRADPDSR
jgi:hypothetical protein